MEITYNVEAVLLELMKRLDRAIFDDIPILRRGSPVPSFGDPRLSKIATLGLNPSNREFVDIKGNELIGGDRRFHTLDSLGLSRWSQATPRHLQIVLESCWDYFQRNPYDTWFTALERLISKTNYSYYCKMFRACHLDLVPYATSCKWTQLSSLAKKTLLNECVDTLGIILNESQVRLLILNGRTVVDTFEVITGEVLGRHSMNEWKLPRQGNAGVDGFAYSGTLKKMAGVELRNPILVLGFNHNIQSSFGVTTHVRLSVANWIGNMAREALA